MDAEQETLEDVAEPLSAEEAGACLGGSVWAPAMVSSGPWEDTDLDREIDAIVKLLKEKGPLRPPQIRRRARDEVLGPRPAARRAGGGAQARPGQAKRPRLRNPGAA